MSFDTQVNDQLSLSTCLFSATLKHGKLSQCVGRIETVAVNDALVFRRMASAAQGLRVITHFSLA
jgi:hypothetical protein